MTQSRWAVASTQLTDQLPVGSFTHSPGEEPLPGYRLLEPLGLGGFGEVWKCEAPGGIHMAVKFISTDKEVANPTFSQELTAFQQIKATSHPFLLTPERMELVGGELVMVMELADNQLKNRFGECLAQGLPGIPRQELLDYLVEAAEALDYLGNKFGVQHLDVKPTNLLIVSDHMKVSDYRLVGRFQADYQSTELARGLMPKYVAPEVLRGEVDSRSDQYCLALVYAELLTGQFPYVAENAQQLMLQHVSALPDLSRLPEGDKPIVAKALSKNPVDRHRTCVEFIRCLLRAYRDPVVAPTRPSQQTPTTIPAGYPAGRTYTNLSKRSPLVTTPSTPNPSLEVTFGQSQTSDLGSLGYGTVPPSLKMPGHGGEDQSVLNLISVVPEEVTTERWPFKLKRMWPVMPVSWLRNESDHQFTAPIPDQFAELVTRSARPDIEVPAGPNDIVRMKDGTWRCRFPVRQVSGVARVKLDWILQEYRAAIEQTSPSCFVIQKVLTSGFFSQKKGGVEISVQLPTTGSGVGMASLSGRIFGRVPDRQAEIDGIIMKMLESTRSILQNVIDRQADFRVPSDIPVTLFPVLGDGTVFEPVTGFCQDVSFGGMCCIASKQIDTAHVFVAPEIAAAAGWAILLRLTRVNPAAGGGNIIAGRFRTDLS